MGTFGAKFNHDSCVSAPEGLDLAKVAEREVGEVTAPCGLKFIRDHVDGHEVLP